MSMSHGFLVYTSPWNLAHATCQWHTSNGQRRDHPIHGGISLRRSPAFKRCTTHAEPHVCIARLYTGPISDGCRLPAGCKRIASRCRQVSPSLQGPRFGRPSCPVHTHVYTHVHTHVYTHLYSRQVSPSRQEPCFDRPASPVFRARLHTHTPHGTSDDNFDFK